MTILPAMQSAAVRLMGRKPTTFFATQTQFEMEIADLVTETAVDIAKAHDWQELLTLKTINGNSTDTVFALPDDFDRMPIKGDIHSASWITWRYTPARDLDQLMDFQSGLSIVTPGIWTLLGGQMQFWPAPASGDQAKFYYVSKNFARAANTAVPQPVFSNDNDAFVLDNRLLTLGLIWRWRSQKRLEYAEDMANYEKALAEIAGRNKAPRILTVGRQRLRTDAGYAYPGNIIP